MSYHVDDTIAAVATPNGGAARGVVRISGADAPAIVERFFNPTAEVLLSELPAATAVPGHVQLELDLGLPTAVPCDLFLWPTGRSYTRQPVAELHLFGAPIILDAALRASCAAGARLAEPGEFTLRAFLAGRIDLTQAEAVLGVIDARGDGDLQTALIQLAGGLARPLHQLREELLQLLAELEAGLDFVEEDIEFVSAAELTARLADAGRLLDEVSAQMVSRLAAGSVDQVALVGPPNAGKSSLFNALVARFGSAGDHPLSASLALTSPEQGTTRDYLTAALNLAGIRCELIDTAGIDADATAPIAAAAQVLATARRAEAALCVWCTEAADPQSAPADSDLVVLTKADTVRSPYHTTTSIDTNLPVIVTSSHTGEGLSELSAALQAALTREVDVPRGLVVATTANRCRDSVELAAAALQRSVDLVAHGSGEEFVAAEIRLALAELGKVIGAVYSDDLLDRIFSSFCIGK